MFKLPPLSPRDSPDVTFPSPTPSISGTGLTSEGGRICLKLLTIRDTEGLTLPSEFTYKLNNA